MIANCPKCNSVSIEKITWTWWGGIIGAWIMNQARCKDCKTKFNRDTGK